jgi:hypothetical protein
VSKLCGGIYGGEKERRRWQWMGPESNLRLGFAKMLMLLTFIKLLTFL